MWNNRKFEMCISQSHLRHVMSQVLTLFVPSCIFREKVSTNPTIWCINVQMNDSVIHERKRRACRYSETSSDKFYLTFTTHVFSTMSRGLDPWTITYTRVICSKRITFYTIHKRLSWETQRALATVILTVKQLNIAYNKWNWISTNDTINSALRHLKLQLGHFYSKPQTIIEWPFLKSLFIVKCLRILLYIGGGGGAVGAILWRASFLYVLWRRLRVLGKIISRQKKSWSLRWFVTGPTTTSLSSEWLCLAWQGKQDIYCRDLRMARKFIFPRYCCYLFTVVACSSSFRIGNRYHYGYGLLQDKSCEQR
jgi:hypothetical protein